MSSTAKVGGTGYWLVTRSRLVMEDVMVSASSAKDAMNAAMTSDDSDWEQCGVGDWEYDEPEPCDEEGVPL